MNELGQMSSIHQTNEKRKTKVPRITELFLDLMVHVYIFRQNHTPEMI